MEEREGGEGGERGGGGEGEWEGEGGKDLSSDSTTYFMAG